MFETSKNWLKSLRGMFAYDSITVSSASELISASLCYSQGGGFNTSLSRLMYCTHALDVVSSPDGAVLVISPGAKSSYTRPPQSFNPSLLR